MVEALQKSQIIIHVEKSITYNIHETRWIPSSAKFISLGGKADGSGIVEVYSLNSNGIEKVSDFGKGSEFKCGTFDASSLRNRHLATGDFKGRLQVFDLENPLVPVYQTSVHTAIINSIDGVAGSKAGCGAPEIVTGSRDGSVMIWDVRQKDSPVTTLHPADGASGRDCWAVAFGNSYNSEERVVAAGYDNGDIKIFDLKAMKERWSKCIKNGVVDLEFDRKDIPINKLVATTLEAKIYCFDLRTFHPTKDYPCTIEKAHKSTVWCCRHLPQNREILMTTGGSGSLCLWKYNYPTKRVENDSDGVPYGVAGELQLLQNCTVSSQPVTTFDWCVDKLGLAVCAAFDQTIRVLITTKLNLL